MVEQGDENLVPQSPDVNAPSRDDRYLSMVIDPIRVCSAYKPRLGQGIHAGLNLSDFQDYTEETRSTIGLAWTMHSCTLPTRRRVA